MTIANNATAKIFSMIFFSPGKGHRGFYSNAKMRFQSFFMLMTVQPSFFASS